eukprot:2089400-Ditylum_brightwellii.AAC.1
MQKETKRQRSRQKLRVLTEMATGMVVMATGMTLTGMAVTGMAVTGMAVTSMVVMAHIPRLVL